MATAVIELHLENLPPALEGLERYGKAFLLCRYHGIPVGQLTVPVIDGSVLLEEIYPQVIDAVYPQLGEAWLDHQLPTADDNPSLPAVTVAICTRNRTADLQRCLDGLRRLPNDGQEILVIDNCPSDDQTKTLVERYPGVRYVREERPGLNIARNRALQEASHEVVAFTDDDAIPDAGWLRAIRRNFQHPLVACVTGLTVPLELETDAQEAFDAYSPFGKGWRRRVYSQRTHSPLLTGGIGAGANMALRKWVLKELGGFDEALDAGTPTLSGGDHEYFGRILAHGFQIVYEPKALSWHRHRRTWKEAYDTVKGYGVGTYAHWTRTFFVAREYGVIRMPAAWFLTGQVQKFWRAALRGDRVTLRFVAAELRGCLMGPFRYAKAKRLRLKQAP